MSQKSDRMNCRKKFSTVFLISTTKSYFFSRMFAFSRTRKFFFDKRNALKINFVLKFLFCRHYEKRGGPGSILVTNKSGSRSVLVTNGSRSPSPTPVRRKYILVRTTNMYGTLRLRRWAELWRGRDRLAYPCSSLLISLSINRSLSRKP